jgi:hypothetical protein
MYDNPHGFHTKNTERMIVSKSGEFTKLIGIPGALPAPWGHGDSSDGKARVYLIGCGRLLKIGISAKVMARLTQLKTGNPYKLDLLASIEVPQELAISIERGAHRRLKFCRISREWFRIAPFAAMAVVDAEMRGHDAWSGLLIEYLRLEHEFETYSVSGEYDAADRAFEEAVSVRDELIDLDYARSDRLFQQSLERWDTLVGAAGFEPAPSC